ncbi:MAG: sensor domain-containing diguanylate cyclase [Anaerolineales bacterium]
MNPAKDFYQLLLDNLYDGVYFADKNRTITYWNRGAENITGYKASEVIGRACRDNLLNHCTENGHELCLDACPLTRSMETGHHQEAEVYLHHADGHRVPVLVRTSPIYGEDGQVIGAVEIFSNNSKLFKARDRIRKLQESSLSDALTGIGNRRLAESKLKSALLDYQQQRQRFGVAMLDIDYFKKVNDTFGHDIGDLVLRMVANTLKANVRQNDTVTRWGGEEFVLIFDDVDTQSLAAVTEKLRMLIERSRLDLPDGKSINVTVSIGASLIQPDDNVETIVKRADDLMYASKENGRNRVTYD